MYYKLNHFLIDREIIYLKYNNQIIFRVRCLGFKTEVNAIGKEYLQSRTFFIRKR
jgi:hypothetical protein